MINAIKDTKITPQRILVVEDNQDILDLLHDWLSGMGYEVAAYTQVSDIIRLAEETNPDLVILDYLVGEINGGEFCHQLKHDSRTMHLPVMMLSAHQRVIDSLGHYGWDAFVAKPFDLEELAQQIVMLLQNQPENTLFEI